MSVNIQAQKKHIDQSEPFENVLLAMKTDSISLFKSVFSKSIKNDDDDDDDDDDDENWKAKLNEGQEKFKEKFGDYKIKSFSYVFNEQDMLLIVYFKKKKISGIRVIKENGVWKLDQH